MPSLSKLYKNNTVVKWGEHGNDWTVTLYQTEIIRFNEWVVTLNHGGFKTLTTATRMNQASNQFGLGYHVSRRKGSFWISFDNGNEYEFPASGKLTFSRRDTAMLIV